MPFSARQQQCLQAMGIVPWVSRSAIDAIGDASSIAGTTAAEEGLPMASAAAPRSPLTADRSEVTRAGTADPDPHAADRLRGLPASMDEAVTPDVSDESAETHTALRDSEAGIAENDASGSRAVLCRAPGDIDQLGPWLQSRPLAPIAYRGAQHPALGNAEAGLFVVLAQQDCSPTAGVMEGDDARLFELMLRAIGLGNRDTRRCLLGVPGSRPGEVGIDTLLTRQSRALLVLMDEWPFDAQDHEVERHRTRFPSPALPVWRIPHPCVLLREPTLKRQAWQVLRQVRSVLNGQSH